MLKRRWMKIVALMLALMLALPSGAVAMRVQQNISTMNVNRDYMNSESVAGLSKNLERLSSGYRLSLEYNIAFNEYQAADEAADLAISEAMRKQISMLNRGEWSLAGNSKWYYYKAPDQNGESITKDWAEETRCEWFYTDANGSSGPKGWQQDLGEWSAKWHCMDESESSVPTGWTMGDNVQYYFEFPSDKVQQETVNAMLQEIQLGFGEVEYGAALQISIDGGIENRNINLGLNEECAGVYAYVTGEGEDLMIGAIGSNETTNGVTVERNAESGKLEYGMQIITTQDRILLNDNFGVFQLGTNGDILLSGKDGQACISEVAFEEGAFFEYNLSVQSGALSVDENSDIGSSDVDDALTALAYAEKLKRAVQLAAVNSLVLDGGTIRQQEDAKLQALTALMERVQCPFCNGTGMHIAAVCTVHCVNEAGDHGPCEHCGERLCNYKKHGQGICGEVETESTTAPVATAEPTAEPMNTATPSSPPVVTAAPTTAPTAVPTATPTVVPTVAPTAVPTMVPTTAPFVSSCPKCGEEVAAADEHLLPCGEYSCTDGYIEGNHEQCGGCGKYECGADYGDAENHGQCEGCGMYFCDPEYDVENHLYCDGCHRFECNSEYANYDHGICEHCEWHLCVDDHSACEHCGGYKCCGGEHGLCEYCGACTGNGSEHGQNICN